MSGTDDRYICVDLETTGLEPKKDKIIEIGAVLVEHGKIKESFESFVNPGRKLSEKITQLTGITDEQLSDAPTIDMVINQFIEFAGDYYLLGHCILFDYSFLKRACVNKKIDFERKGIDTLTISRKYLAELPSRKLDSLCEYYGIKYQSHRALEDAKATVALFQKLKEQFENSEDALTYFSPKQLIYKVKREQPIQHRQKERLYKLIQMHNIEIDYDINMLTRNEASRYTDQILAKFGR